MKTINGIKIKLSKDHIILNNSSCIIYYDKIIFKCGKVTKRMMAKVIKRNSLIAILRFDDKNFNKVQRKYGKLITKEGGFNVSKNS